MNSANRPQSGHLRPSSGHHHNHLTINPLPLFSPSTAPTRFPSLESPSPPARIFLIYLLAYRLAHCYQSIVIQQQHQQQQHHEKKQKLNGSLAIA
jgi:hypothetical protein